MNHPDPRARQQAESLASTSRDADDAARVIGRQVIEGLGAPQKRLDSAWFYDDEGSRLFQRIMTLPEYYLTRVEHQILLERGAELAAAIAHDGRPVDLVELGSGDGEKTLTLARALARAGARFTLHPMDLSALALSQLSSRFAQHLPEVPVRPVCGDYFRHWPATDPASRQVVLLMGSNLGNLTRDQSVALLRRVRERLRDGDALVLGLDRIKDPQVILAAYNDSAGVTREFNLNLLARLNRELAMDFDLSAFDHYPTYSPLDGAARSFLVSRRRQRVGSAVLGRHFDFEPGEAIYTEQSQKYNDAMIDDLARASGFDADGQLRDPRDWYSVVVLRAAGHARWTALAASAGPG